MAGNRAYLIRVGSMPAIGHVGRHRRAAGPSTRPPTTGRHRASETAHPDRQPSRTSETSRPHLWNAANAANRTDLRHPVIETGRQPSRASVTSRQPSRTSETGRRDHASETGRQPSRASETGRPGRTGGASQPRRATETGRKDPRRHRDLPGIRARLDRTAPRRAALPAGVAALLVVFAGAATISGWFAATGAVAFVGMIGH